MALNPRLRAMVAKSKHDHIMNKFMFATMTEKELFERFLDAPLRAGPTSTLFEGKEVGETPGEILGEPIYDADCIPEDMGICMLDRLSESDDPAGDMVQFLMGRYAGFNA